MPGGHTCSFISSPPPFLLREDISARTPKPQHNNVNITKHHQNQITYGNNDNTADESSRLDVNSESDRAYETKLTEPDFDASRDRRRSKPKRQQLHYKPSTPVTQKNTTTQ
ncbi:hypothetical protein GX48_00910 [Paracoccidioides brasiliensis]|nr:hypothetical protein GX48_00910 [Paracoccidioides brasiliensis]